MLYKGTGAKAHPASTLRPANNYSWLYLLLGGECPHKTESNRKERGNNQPRVTWYGSACLWQCVQCSSQARGEATTVPLLKRHWLIYGTKVCAELLESVLSTPPEGRGGGRGHSHGLKCHPLPYAILVFRQYEGGGGLALPTTIVIRWPLSNTG